MKPEMIAQLPNGELKMFATMKIDIGGNAIYWGYIEGGGEKTKITNLSTVLSRNPMWQISEGIEI